MVLCYNASHKAINKEINTMTGNEHKERGSIMLVVAAIIAAALVGTVGVFAYTHFVAPPPTTSTSTTASTSPSLSPSASTSTTVTGNNGTLKIHEKDTPSGTESNDPKVCIFNLEGFNFDNKQSGLIKFTPQGGDSATTDTAQLAFGPASSTGYTQTDYVNGPTGPSVSNGHYKSTLYGKDNKGNYTIDLKAKSKVFEVNCFSSD
jgi:cytoskeletal protein RodZ